MLFIVNFHFFQNSRYHARERLVRLNYVMYFKKNTHLKTLFDETIDECLAAGIYVAGQRKFFDENNVKESFVENEGKQRKPLTLDQISGCFQVLTFGVCFVR